LFTSTNVAPDFQMIAAAPRRRPRPLRDILEFEVAEIAKKPAALGFADHENIGPAVPS